MPQPSSSMSFLASTPRSLKPGHGAPEDLEALPVPGARRQLVDGLAAHVVAGEHGVDDADALHRPILARRRRIASPRWGRRVVGPRAPGGQDSSAMDDAPGTDQRRLGPARRGRRLARLHPDGHLRRQLARSWSSGPRAASSSTWTATALPRRHLVAVGDHARAPDPRARRRRARPARPDRALDPARQRQPGGGRAVRGAGRRRARRPAPHALRVRRRHGRSSRRSRSPSSTGRTSGSTGRHRFLVLGNAYHGDTVGSLSLGDGGFGTDVFAPLRFDVVRAPGYDDPDWLAGRAGASSGATTASSPPWWSSRWSRARRACSWPSRPTCPRWARRAARTACCSSPTRWPPASAARAGCSPREWCDLRPDLLCLGKGLTGGYLPMSATVAVGPRLRGVPRRGPRAAHLLPRALLRRERPGRGGGPRASAPHRPLGRAGQRQRPGRPARRACSTHQVAGHPGVARRAPTRPHGRDRARPAVARRRAGDAGCAPARWPAACCCAPSATSSCSCRRSTVTAEEIERIVVGAGRVARRRCADGRRRRGVDGARRRRRAGVARVGDAAGAGEHP